MLDHRPGLTKAAWSQSLISHTSSRKCTHYETSANRNVQHTMPEYNQILSVTGPQTNLWHREEETQNTDSHVKASGFNVKQPVLPSMLSKMAATKYYITKQGPPPPHTHTHCKQYRLKTDSCLATPRGLYIFYKSSFALTQAVSTCLY